MSKKNKSKAKSHYVAKLGIDRCYGGPEEGGWWYDWTHVQEIWTTGSRSAAKRLIESLRKEEDKYKPRHDRFSVLGGTDISFVRARSLSEVQSHQTTHRPRYC